MADVPLMAGKSVLVTGGTGGIGMATAAALAALGARVGISGRAQARAAAAAAGIRAATGNPAVDVFTADMSVQTEVRRLAAQVAVTYPRLDVLVNNVGGFWAHRHATADGLERTFALNHLAPGRGRHRPVLRQPQAQDLRQDRLRHLAGGTSGSGMPRCGTGLREQAKPPASYAERLPGHPLNRRVW
jgi:NAD(P)-dependent dehydrogenase (short-subunit alcohol dehydrogenase family)